MKFYERLLLNVLKQGAIPSHVAFIMDGNRRWATGKGMKKAEGHKYGLDRLKWVLEVCMELGVKKCSVYAFSIENYNREKEELDALMSLMRDSLQKMTEKSEFFDKNQIQVRLCGDMSLVQKELVREMETATKRTAQNNKLQLNVCFSYSGFAEITSSLHSSMKEWEERGSLLAKEKMESLQNHLWVKDFPDLMIRTSGEIRLSDFLPLQCSFSNVYFVQESWPSLSLWSIVKILLDYQMNKEKFDANKKRVMSCLGFC